MQLPKYKMESEQALRHFCYVSIMLFILSKKQHDWF